MNVKIKVRCRGFTEKKSEQKSKLENDCLKILDTKQEFCAISFTL